MNNKYFSKALCYADRSHCFSILIMTSLFMLFTALSVSLDGPSHIIRLFNISVITTVIIFVNIIIVFFSYSDKKAKQFYITTQPYNRDTVIFTKLIAFSLSFIIPIVIYAVIVSLLYLTGTKGVTAPAMIHMKSPMIILWKNVLSSSVAFISMIVSVQFIQTLFGKCKYAFIIPFIFFAFILPITIALISLYSCGLSTYIVDFLKTSTDVLANWLESYVNFMVESPIWQFIHDLSGIIIFLPITVILNRKIKSEKTSDIFLFKPVEVIFKVSLSLFCGFCSVTIVIGILLLLMDKLRQASINISIEGALLTVICIIILIVGFILSALAYKIINKIQARRA